MSKKRHAAVGGMAVASVLACAALVACGGGGGGGSGTATGSSVSSGGATLGNCEMFPPQAVFNTAIDDTSRFPAHAQSSNWIASVGGGTAFHADWWNRTNPADSSTYFGMPVNVVDGTAATTDWANMSYDYSGTGYGSGAGWPHESDCAVADGSGGYALQRGCSAVAASERRFPIPTVDFKQEAGTCNNPDACGDKHLLVVEQGACRLWESYHTYNVGGLWRSLSSAAWNLNSLEMRPNGWTSGDAAGLPITPFLAKAAEADSGEIRHALRVTFRDSVLSNSYVWPARHGAGGSSGAIPFGSLLRLKADFVIPAGWTPQAKAIATAAKRYGMYVSDIGSDFYVQGEPNAAWNDQTFSDLRGIPLSAMEFVDTNAITSDARFNVNSMAGRW